MPESQLKLTIEDAIIVPNTITEYNDHCIIRAYTLNP